MIRRIMIATIVAAFVIAGAPPKHLLFGGVAHVVTHPVGFVSNATALLGVSARRAPP